MNVPWLKETKDGILLLLLIQPKASRSAFVGPHGEPPRLKVRIAAPPVDGEANEELRHFLKKQFHLPASSIQIIRGHTSKMKDVLLLGANIESVDEVLNHVL